MIHEKNHCVATGKLNPEIRCKVQPFIAVKLWGLKGRCLPDYNLDWPAVIQALTPANNLKENRVFRVGDLVIKRFPLRFLHADRCLAAFRMSGELKKREVNHPHAVAYLKGGGYSYFASQWLENAVTVNEYFSGLARDPVLKRRRIHELAMWVAKLHDLDIYQRDFKSCNILVHDHAFRMVDLEGVRLRKPSEHDKIYNLAQLNASMSRYVSLKDRLLFWSAYAENCRIPRAQWRGVWQRIWDVLLKKNTAYYDLVPEDLWPPGKTASRLKEEGMWKLPLL